MSDFPDFVKPTRQVTTYKVCAGMTQYKSFVQERNTHSSCRTKRDTIGLSRLRVVFARNGKRRFCMFCPSVGRCSVTTPEGGLTSP
ncbi:hypothetical protein PoB_003745300 [Plakobranchus ocellatus]|uniref:Uncharacterized protein n=1 Tax=Plakobranchus ocellatus TaxID=259542 RepID=A0AAV4AWQ0_9GAST|nr:hypothetical protein PoB_003745300 [Plakobranchus ocellatus]